MENRAILSVKTTIIIVIFFLTLSVYSQDDTNDFDLWSTIGVEYDINKKLSLALEVQLRLEDSFSELEEYFSELSATYKIAKKFYTTLGLRYIREIDNEGKIQGDENYFRFNIDGIYKHKINDFSFAYRLRYQNKNELGVSNLEGDYANKNIRLKAGIKYNISKWPLDPKLSAEIFNHFQEGEVGGFTKYRITLGTSYKIKKAGKISLFYRYQKQINTSDETDKIIGIKYIYAFKN